MQCKAIKTAVNFLVLSTWLMSNASWAEDWKLEKQQHNVSVYSKQTDSGYKEIMVKTIVETNPHALIALFNDVAFSSQWIHNCIEVKMLEVVSPTERLINTFFEAPWPVKDRDMVTLSSIKTSEHSVQIEITDRGEVIPKHKKFVRMQNMHGLWEADTIEEGKSEITYTGGGNPGGNLPTFIANRELISSMLKTFQNLNKVILLEKYQPIYPQTTSE
ncbi:START domain-containing protein [uncultured Paraglaciecola sp.]|uniref:START domain-containing protein n=1 Tax=uncultured Paraglaciecola sp. TaxID=1765024 RepID=UPI0030D8F3A8